MWQFLTAYTVYFSRLHQRVGHLLQGRFQEGDDAGVDCEAVEDGMSAHGGKLPEENHQ
jgi:hypothetical protein